MSTLAAATLTALREAGFTRGQWIAWIDEDMGYTERDGRWYGDRCGCPDDRCIGFHHGPGDECGCREVFIARFREVRPTG